MKGNREVGETIYIDGYPTPIKATIVKVAEFAWSLHTVLREDMTQNTTALEKDIVDEAYALHMRAQYSTTQGAPK